MIRPYTKKEDQFIRNNYLLLPSCTISRMLKRSKSSARQRMARLGIEVPKELVEQFKKQSYFKPGIDPLNTKQDGAVCIRADKLGNRYQFIRLSKANWIPLHRHKWTQVNGAIPKDLKLIFKDGNTLNCSIDNLELVTAGELMKRNSYHKYPKPLALMVQLRGALNRQINIKLKTINQ